MVTTANDLTEFWSSARGAFVHPKDQPLVSCSEFAVRLHPVPWAGPLSASVFLLFLNPGLDPDDEGYEKDRPDFLKALRDNLSGREPYLYLQDRFYDHPGYRWARRTFGDDIDQIDLEKICVLQLVPYHSEKGAAARRIAPKLRSSQIVRDFVRTTIIPRAKAKEISIIVARSSKLWEVSDTSLSGNIVIYEGAEPRRAFQTPKSRGGALLRQALGKPTGE